MSTRPFHDIPFVEPSDEMAADPARAIAERYARHGAIFRTTTPFGHDLVYLVGPEANRFVLATERLKFSHRVGWGELLGVIEVYGDGLLTGKRALVVVSHSLQRAEHGEQPVWMGMVLAAALGQIGLPGGGYGYALGAIAYYGRRSNAVPTGSVPQGRNGVRDFIMLQPWRAFVPGLAIFLASMSINFIGDALRDALDPRLKL